MSSTVFYQLGRAISSKVDRFDSPVRKEVSGIEIWFTRGTDDELIDRWMAVFEEWLPRFESVGWLDEFALVKVGSDLPHGDAAGRYNDGIIIIDDNPFDKQWWMNGVVLDDTFEHVFVHEMLHHAHSLHDDTALLSIPVPGEQYITDEVSMYAADCLSEMIAETGAGIARGVTFPEDIEQTYDENGGPQEVYELRNG